MSVKTDKRLRNLIKKLTDKGGIVPDDNLSAVAMSSDRDVTDLQSEDLGDFIKQTVQNGYTCVVYSAGNRIMISVHG